MSNTAPRTSTQERKSAETDIRLELNLDGQGITDVKTGFGLLDHMLTLTAFWGGMDLRLVCEGDMEVDAHHTTEDVGLLFGKALLEADRIDFPLTVRSFRPGDRFQPLGMEGEKKIKDFFIDQKIPLAQRRKIPLLFFQDQLLWVAGLRLDDRFRVKPESRRVLQIELR